MKTMDVIDSLCDNANAFVLECENTGIEQNIINAIIVDFVNYFSGQYGVDLAMYTDDLTVSDKRRKINIDKSVITPNLHRIKDKYNNIGIIESVNRNKHMNKCEGKAELENEKALKIVDEFINFYSN
jgi:hypothetical protein